MGDAQKIDALHRRHMDRAIELALRGAGRVSPNPMVGCVIVRNGDAVVGEGWHAGPGTPHAEVGALKDAGDKARGAAAYVTLEPCNHHGNTGPCAEALIAAGIGEVIYGMDDPNPLAAGGAERLRAAGVKVRGGVCEDSARHLNRAWLHFIEHKRPYIIGKTAMTLDGRIATASGESKWITSNESRKAGHQLRAAADAIIAGAGTIIADDPALTARTERGTTYPLRVVLDSTARTAPGAKVYERSAIVGRGRALLATTDAAPAPRLSAFKEMGVDILVLPADDTGRPDLRALLAALYERNIVSVLIEGGGEVLGGFFDADLLDEIEMFVAPKLFGGGKTAFGGGGVERLAEAEQFSFQQMETDGPDFRFRGVRRREGS
jgi:diaminohydroxyphosphoribosylaminopyrimidine deaminase / 5-amino-6-(5-phosphoribosylamino)uracil reductase